MFTDRNVCTDSCRGGLTLDVAKGIARFSRREIRVMRGRLLEVGISITTVESVQGYTPSHASTPEFLSRHRQDRKEDRKRKNLHCREPTDTVGQRVPPMLVLTIQGGNRWNS